jgi:AcrR family transcriptional regulator
MRAAYDLFSRNGTQTVGVDSVIAKAGVAKMTLYRNFASKAELVLAFLRRREELWTYGWVQAEIMRRASTPTGRLLAIFDLFDEWFHSADFEGCPFVTVLLESSDPASPIRQASVAHLSVIRGLLSELAAAAGIEDADAFARQWHILLKGSIISAHEGDLDAARRAKEVGELLLKHHGVRS